jgi:serine/threonine-protein kinase
VTSPFADRPDWRLIEPYLDGALDLDPASRERWLSDLATTQPAVASKVRGLLAELQALDANGFLHGSVLPEMGAGVQLEGSCIGAYTIDRLIGRGGMGEVWLAHRSDGRFEGHYAIKFLAGPLAWRTLEHRFQHEGRVLARLVHPHIARLIDAGTTAEGRHYLVLEYVDGQHIDQYCESKSLGVEARVGLFLDVVSAVAHAHSHLIIHRDLKPANVFVGRGGVVKLLDFGIAKLLSPEDASSDQGTPTRFEERILTPEYAAPEQLLGDLPSTATDVYQLGMLLYVLLTGKHPLSASSSRTERIKAAIEGKVPRPSDLASGAACIRLRGDLDAIVLKALRKDPAERYATAAALREDLVRYLKGEAVSAREGALYRAYKFVSQHRAAVTAAALGAAVLLGAFMVTTVQLVETRKQREAALVSTRHAEATKNFLQLVLSEVQSRDEPLTNKVLLERSSALLRAQYQNQPEFVSEMLIELATEYIDIAELNTALPMLLEARDRAAQIHNYRLMALAECEMAGDQARSGIVDESRKHIAQGLQALGQLQQPDVNVRAVCMHADAKVHAATSDRPAAIEIEQKARAMMESAGETHGVVYSIVLWGLGADLMESGRVTDALAVSQLVMSNNAANGRAGTRMQLLAEQNVAATLYRLGEIRESHAMRLRIRAELSKTDHPDEMRTAFVVNEAISANRLLRQDPALELLPGAVDRAEREGDLVMLRVASVELARTRMLMGLKRPEVEAPLNHLDPATISADPGARVLVDSVRIELDLREGKLKSADQRASQLVHDLTAAKSIRPRSAYLASALASRTALAVGDGTRAAVFARSALHVVEPMARGPDTSADVGEALLMLGRALIAQDQVVEARPLLQRAVRCLRNGYGPDHPTTREAEALIGIAGTARFALN